MKLLTFLLLFTVKANYIVAIGISNSDIPNDCKQLYLAITIKESNWHKNHKAIRYNNYSGFMQHNKLMKFNSLKHYITFSEQWFIRKHIKTEYDLIKFIKAGKYAKNPKVYLKDVLKIKKSINNYYKILNEKTNSQ